MKKIDLTFQVSLIRPGFIMGEGCPRRAKLQSHFFCYYRNAIKFALQRGRPSTLLFMKVTQTYLNI